MKPIEVLEVSDQPVVNKEACENSAEAFKTKYKQMKALVLRVLFILCFEFKRAEPLAVPMYSFGAHPSALLVHSASIFPKPYIAHIIKSVLDTGPLAKHQKHIAYYIFL